MNKSVTEDHSEELKKFLYDIINQSHQNSGKGILLANLGWAIYHQRPHLRDFLGKRKISEFLAQEMPDQIQISPSPDNISVKIATPIPSLKIIEVQDIKQITPTIKSRRAYAGAAFLAFSRPLASGFQRILTFQPTLYFEDVPADSPVSTGSYLITSEFIVQISANRDAESLFDENVDQWLKTNNIPLKDLLRPKKPAHTKQLNKLSALDILITALSEADLKRIQMPLDIIAKLQKTTH